MSAYYSCPDCQTQYTLTEGLSIGVVCSSCGARLVLQVSAGESFPPRDNGSERRDRSHYPVPSANGAGGTSARDRVRFESAVGEGDPEDVVALSIVPPHDALQEIPSIEQLINALGAVTGTVSLEIAADENRPYLIVRCRRRDADFVQEQLLSTYGSPVFEGLEPQYDPAVCMEAGDGLVATARLGLQDGPHLPLRTWQELEGNDTIRSLLGAARAVREDEIALSQVLIHGLAPEGWSGPYKRKLNHLRRRGYGSFRVADVLYLLALMLGAMGVAYFFLVGTFSETWFSAGSLVSLLISSVALYLGAPAIINQTPGARWDESMESQVEAKLQGTAYRCEVRLAARAATPDRAQQLLKQMAAAYNQFSRDAGNQLIIVPPPDSPQFTAASLNLYGPAEMLLNTSEISGMWHLPIDDLPDLLPGTRHVVLLPVPDQVLHTSGLHIGEARKTSGVRVPVYLPSDAVENHTLLLGRTRMGKSTLAQHIAIWAMRQPGRAVVVADPHRDMVDELLDHIPPGREGDVILIDLADDDYIPAFNLLDVHTIGGPERVVESIVDVIFDLWPEGVGSRMVVPMRMLLMALALANTQRAPDQQFTMLALSQLITLNPERRAHFLREMLPKDDPHTSNVISYFEGEYDPMSRYFRERVVSPVLSKARAFEFNSRIREMVGQPACTINPWRFITEGKIVLFHTARPTVGDEFASFMGSLVLNYARRAILAQGAVPPQDRVPATVIVDEAHTMAAVNFASVMAEAQKFKGSLVLTAQGLSSLNAPATRKDKSEDDTPDKILANIDNLVLFRAGGSDARYFAGPELGDAIPATSLTFLPKHTAYVRTTLEGNVLSPFAVQTKPMPAGDPNSRAEAYALRPRYSVARPDAAEAAHRSMKAILHYFSTEVAASTAVHDGAFGDLLGSDAAFPEALEGDLVDSPGGPKGDASPAAGDQEQDETSGEDREDASHPKPSDPATTAELGQSSRDRMLNMLDRIEGWFDESAEGENEPDDDPEGAGGENRG